MRSLAVRRGDLGVRGGERGLRIVLLLMRV